MLSFYDKSDIIKLTIKFNKRLKLIQQKRDRTLSILLPVVFYYLKQNYLQFKYDFIMFKKVLNGLEINKKSMLFYFSEY